MSNNKRTKEEKQKLVSELKFTIQLNSSNKYICFNCALTGLLDFPEALFR